MPGFLLSIFRTAMTTITKIAVPTQGRPAFLPRHVGMPTTMLIEASIYTQLSRLCPAYQGGLWDFYDLTNGGCFMAPHTEETLRLANAMNDSDATISAEAAGIVACLYTFSHLAFRPGMAHIGEHFHWLREFALEHPESAAILALID